MLKASGFLLTISKDIGKLKILTDYHNIIYKLTGLPIDFVSAKGKILRLCPYKHFNKFCRLIRSTSFGRRACNNSDFINIELAKKGKKPIVYTCHAGLIDIVVPLFVNKKYVGCLTSGQILTRKPTESSFSKAKEKLHTLKIDKDKLKEYYFNIPVLDDKKIKALVKLISLISNYILETQNKIIFLEKTRERDKISLARRYIEKNFTKKISILDVADVMYLSPSHFSHVFKKQVGISFIQYLNRFRIERARDLLVNSTLNVTEIAFQVGFQSLTHFNRIFRKFQNISPMQLRKQKK